DSTVTDASGAYDVPSSGPVALRAELRGPYIDVNRADVIPMGGDDAHYAITTSTSPADITWGNDGFSHDSERDALRNPHRAHDHGERLAAWLTGLDCWRPIVVNFPYGNCNAQWTGSAIYLYTAGGGCANTSSVPSVVMHEYGHAVNDFVYLGDGLPLGMQNASMQEGTADLFAAFLRDDPVIGAGFYGLGTWVRTLANTLHWPEDRVTDPHANGDILAGAFWDLRQAVGLPLAERLSHQAKHGHPDDVHDDVAFMEMFLETLVADDDDGNLANGTPHALDIPHA